MSGGCDFHAEPNGGCVHCTVHALGRARSDVERLEGVVRFLWQLLDNIDTADDMAKSDDAAYRRIAKAQQARRWESGITTDGYTIDLGGAAAPTPVGSSTEGAT